MMIRTILNTGIVSIVVTILATPAWTSELKEIIYMSNDDFLSQSFEATPELKTVWLKGVLKTEVSKTLGHDYPALRIRYWQRGERSSWILEEIGRDKPITIGFVIQNSRIVAARVLVFRESRGDEIHYPAFTRQFEDAALDSKQRLDRRIDGISGATLSVNAMRKLATVALQLAAHIMNQHSGK